MKKKQKIIELTEEEYMRLVGPAIVLNTIQFVGKLLSKKPVLKPKTKRKTSGGNAVFSRKQVDKR